MSIEIYVDKELKYKFCYSKEAQTLLIECMKRIRNFDDSYQEFTPLKNEHLLIQELTVHSPICPNTPIKQRHFQNISSKGVVQNMQNRLTCALDLAGIERPCKRKMISGKQCTHNCYKYRRCKYHLAVWNKKNPFVGHP